MGSTIKTAFFDFDETVISFKSMFSFLKFYLSEVYQSEGEKRFDEYMNDVNHKWLINFPREEINRNYYRQFKNENKEKLLSIRNRWIAEEKNIRGDNFYIHETQELIQNYKRDNYSIVIVSGSMLDIVEPLANEIGVDTVLATKMITDTGVFTGEIVLPQTIGQGKAVAIINYMRLHNISPEHTVAWGDHISDFPMLEVAGKGGIISSDPDVLSIARTKGFSVINRNLN